MPNLFLTCKECVLESPTNFYGSFYLGPFNSSQSLTVANGLRRTLLSEVPTLAIQNLSIEGVEHEFCTYPGVRESILDLLLNFKQIVLKYSNSNILNEENSKEFLSKKPLYGYLNVRGPGIIRASDLKLPPSILSVDPNQYIATLTTDGALNLRFTIAEGVSKMQDLKRKEDQKSQNFLTKEFPWFINQKIFKQEKTEFDLNSKSFEKSYSNNKFKNSNVLWLDPVFSPILRVNYIIESCSPLELDPVNQVLLVEIWTNGSLHPRDALYFALKKLNFIFLKLEQMKILNNVFSKSILKSEKFYSKTLKKIKYDYHKIKFSNLKKLKANLLKNSNRLLLTNKTFLKNPQKPISENFDFYNFKIDALNLPFRIKNSLINANIVRIKDLLSLKSDALKKIRGIGNQEFHLLVKKLSEKGLKLNP